MEHGRRAARRCAAAIGLALAGAAPPTAALTPEAREFIAILARLEPVHCEKRKLRREIALAEVQREPARAKELRAKFDALGREAQAARLEARLGVLERRILDDKGRSRDPEDLEAISRAQREAFYRCE